MAILYRHIRLDKNEPFYIGIGNTERRATRTDSRNPFWKNIAKKGYRVDILFDDLTWEEACEKEKEFIKLYGRKDLGTGTLVNMTDGGDGTINILVSDETKQKLREINLGKSHSEETKQKMSESRKGEKHPFFGIRGEESHMYGKSHSEESKQKISESKKGEKNHMFFKTGEKHHMYGKKHSEESKQKMSESQKGRKVSAETIEKKRNSMIGKNSKYNKEFIEMIKQRILSGETTKKITTELNLSSSTFYNLKNKIIWQA
jgi:hypothetical protein